MSIKPLIMGGVALVFGTVSYYAGDSFTAGKSGGANAPEMRVDVPKVQEARTVPVVIASKSLKFGDKLGIEDLKLTDWPKDSLPSGARHRVEDVLGEGRRTVLGQIEAGEPVLEAKLTGANANAGLAAIIEEGMRAVTIPIDPVSGVAGFVQPYDRVDVVFIDKLDKDKPADFPIILQNVKVLTIGQQAITRSQEAKLVNTITLETDTEGARILTMAARRGKLSLLLRGAGDNADVTSLTGSVPQITPELDQGYQRRVKRIKVVHGTQIVETEVPID